MAKLQSKKTRLHNINVSKWILRVDLIQKPFGKSSHLKKNKMYTNCLYMTKTFIQKTYETSLHSIEIIHRILSCLRLSYLQINR